MVKVYLPDLGENVEKATVSYWYFEEGAAVTEGQDIVEVVTDKATFNVPAPITGTLVEIAAHEGDNIVPGETLGIIEEESSTAEQE